jgi:hypothetical protein
LLVRKYIKGKVNIKIKKMMYKYSLDCSYFDKEFDTVDELISYCLDSGMDPNYEITRDGKKTGEILVDYLVE